MSHLQETSGTLEGIYEWHERSTDKVNLVLQSIDHAAKLSPVPSVISMQTDQSKGDPPVFTEELAQSTRMSTAGLEGVLCSVCPKMAFKSCLTCIASFCELHVRQHYTTPALQRHRLMEATGDLEQRLCQQHYRELEFFCQTDQSPVCALCLIKQHRQHDIADVPKNMVKAKMAEHFSRKRNRLVARVNNIQNAIRMEEMKQNKLQQIQRALQKNIETFEVDEPYKALIPVEMPWYHWNKGAVCCTFCKENCHYPNCWWAKDVSECRVITNNRCTVCTNTCPVSAHVKHMYIYVPQTKKVVKTAAVLKQQYEKPEDIAKELNETEEKQCKLLNEAFQWISVLDSKTLKKYAFSCIDLWFFYEKKRELSRRFLC